MEIDQDDRPYSGEIRLVNETDKLRCSTSPDQAGQIGDSEEWREGMRAVKNLRRELQQPQFAHLLERLRGVKDERDVREEKAVAQMRTELTSRNLLEPSLNDYYVLLR